MRAALIASLVAVASAYRSWIGVDTRWATHPDRTAQWYDENAQGRLPELAQSMTTVVANKSSIVKLECMGCPFRVRKLHAEPEEWQEPPQDSSLLLNFTIDASTAALLLNGQPVAALAPMPLHIHAFQVNANFTEMHMRKAIDLQMMDKSWNLGTKYGKFELQYEHTVVATREPGKSWIQFDVTGILYPYAMHKHDPKGYYELQAGDQKLVQILLREKAEPHELSIEDVQLVDRKDRAKPYAMPCGRLAMAQTTFKPLEWDDYGKIGTWSRWFNLLWDKTGELFLENLIYLPVVIVVVPALVLLRWMTRRQQQQQVALPTENDAEAALVDSEHQDTTPEAEYVDREEKV
ncbi:uncharacterized protein CC84DRAFT_1080633 [Paraphaeosphaeria sporulosa]|uniref:Uncharacterized protein n=1 Tax=Paraphaeosphaeria sporulosa TaxID=1460663 RepID=A0A177CXK2_9PLEO|nr:uncharacterized protein CC84DRAFT_1080633 [Paraphaeosphaeria sporulosa]OAG11580.1 hypothetical protein CC84DRAFT_1080633 [Paraphaeosphaeria sporulosa]